MRRALRDGRGEVDDARGELDCSRGLAIGVEQVVRAAGGGALGREGAGRASEQRARRAADHDQRVRVALLRHQRAGATQRVADLEKAELVTLVDLEVLGEAAGVGGRGCRVPHGLGQAVGGPHGVARVLDRGVEAEPSRESFAVDWKARAVDPARAGRAGVGRREVGRESLRVPQHGVRERQQPVPGGRRLRRLQVRVVGHRRVALMLRLLDQRSREPQRRVFE